jgi:hypothetical protein
MTNQAPNRPFDMNDIRVWFWIVACLQGAILVAIILVFLYFDALPRQVAELPPEAVSDNSGQIYQLQQSIDALTQQVNTLQSSLDKALTSPTPSPSPSGK